MRSLHPETSRAVLIGVAEYPDGGKFESVEGAVHNVLRLKGLLTDPAYTGFHRTREYTRMMFNPHTADGIRVAVKRAAEQATDVLFVYYVGHASRVGTERELYLTTCTTASPESIETTGLRYAVLRGLLRSAKARVVVLVLDCCFSGSATKMLGDQTLSEEELAEQALEREELLDQAEEDELPAQAEADERHIDGVCILASSGPTQPSAASDTAGGTLFTAFTGNLLAVLENGASDTSPLLLGELFRRAEKRMDKHRVGHQPLMATVGLAANLVMRQAATPPGPAPAPVPAPQGPTGPVAGAQPHSQPLPPLLSWLPDGTFQVHDREYADQIMDILRRSIGPPPFHGTPAQNDTTQEGKHDGH